MLFIELMLINNSFLKFFFIAKSFEFLNHIFHISTNQISFCPDISNPMTYIVSFFIWFLLSWVELSWVNIAMWYIWMFRNSKSTVKKFHIAGSNKSRKKKKIQPPTTKRIKMFYVNCLFALNSLMRIVEIIWTF